MTRELGPSEAGRMADESSRRPSAVSREPLFNEERLSRFMAEAGLDGIVASAPHHVTYLTGFDSPHMTLYPQLEVFAVYERAGAGLSLVMSIDLLDVHLERTIRADRVWTYGTWGIAGGGAMPVREGDDPVVARLFEARENCPWRRTAGEALVDALASLGLRGARVGLDGAKIGPATRECLLDRGRCSVVDCDGVLLAARTVKTAPEVRRLRSSCALVEAAFAKACERVSQGDVSEADLWTVARRVWAEGGAEPGHWETCVGSRTVGFFAASAAARVRDGDIIRFEAGCRLDSYYADSGRTAVLGKPGPAVSDAYRGLEAAIEEGLAYCAPGVATGDLYRRVMAEMRKHLPDYELPYVGHGIGLQMYDPPLIAERASDIYGMGSGAALEEGMVINLEVPYQRYGLGGLQLEETLLVTATGARPLNTSSRELWRLDRAGAR